MLDQQSKINVEFKPSKRMKKRRELDALVGNGKTRRKSKSGHELLRSDSESSEIDEFSLSAQKSFMRNKGHGSAGCSCVTVFGIFLVGTCLLACVALLWMHFQMKQDLDEMRDKISSVESRNQNGLGDYQDLRNKVQTVNQTIQGIKAGGDVQTERMKQTLTNITYKIHQLSMTTESLQDGLKAAPEIKQIAAKVPVVVSTAAKLGVSVKSMQTTIDELLDFKKKTETELDALMDKTSTPTTSSGDSSSMNMNFQQDTLDKFNAMTQTLAAVNSSLWSKIDIWQQDFSQRQAKYIENATNFLKMKMQKTSDTDLALSGSTSPPGGREGGDGEHMTAELTDAMEAEVNDIVHQMVLDMDLMNRTEADSKALDSLLTKMDNVTAIVQTLRDQFNKVQKDHVSLGKSDETDVEQADQMNELKQDVNTQIQDLNKTVQGLLHDFGAVSKHYLTMYSNQVKVMATVEGLKNYLGGMEKKLNQISEEDHSGIPPPPPPPPHFPVVKIPGINSLSDLKTSFSRWDKDGNELVSRQDMDGFMPEVPSEELLKPYDIDNDGLYSLDEMIAAFGYTEMEAPQPTEESNSQQ
ncbi:EF-hand calcium-binding domain-containing protein 14-like isoform X1 [Ylistrum balloti]|uniref:EF-hand calcium-binding domain-containing protein 14-like isoform X1 n=1 Tax=Ylistrum balloti TaxID=509963 RepID=UPI0029059793|nr:EF-hand calcium-binding domain-containing protein 14-like isoform X1 [Ylistrum balloti]